MKKKHAIELLERTLFVETSRSEGLLPCEKLGPGGYPLL